MSGWKKVVILPAAWIMNYSYGPKSVFSAKNFIEK